MDWVSTRKRLPANLDAYDVTLKDSYGSRLVNVALYRPLNSTWELLTEKHNYEDCKVVAWKKRCEPYLGE